MQFLISPTKVIYIGKKNQKKDNFCEVLPQIMGTDDDLIQTVEMELQPAQGCPSGEI